MKAVEMHYTATQIALLTQRTPKFIKDEMKAGKFGPDVFFLGGEFVATASAVNGYLEQHRFPTFAAVRARSVGELRRKLGTVLPD
jgi:hypothetical protein